MRLTCITSSIFLLLTLLSQQRGWAQETDSVRVLAMPNPIPDSILGTVEYYHWRETDFRLRTEKAGIALESPTYYCSYGHKYANRFSWQIRPHLSCEGQHWLDRTLLLLQLGTEACLRNQPTLEMYPERFNRTLFDLHPEVYAAAGFYELSLIDQMRIIIRLDPYDLISREGRRQAKTLLRDYLKYKIQRLLTFG